MQGRDYDIKGRVNLDRVEKEVLFTGNDNSSCLVLKPS